MKTYKIEVTTEDIFCILREYLLTATQMAAINSARQAGKGDKNKADAAAVDTMRETLSHIPGVKFTVKIGEGEKDKAPQLFIGEKIGKGKFLIDIAVDPLENTNATANLGPNAICIIAATESGGIVTATDGYMNKIVGGRDLVGVLDIRKPLSENIYASSKALNRDVDDLTVCILDRERNKEIINSGRTTAARIHLIKDGDLAPCVETCITGSGIHIVAGSGGTTETVAAACAVRALGGVLQAMILAKDPIDREKLLSLGYRFDKVYFANELVLGNRVVVCITAVTHLCSATKPILDGVSFFGGGALTNSLIITNNKYSFEKTTHRLDPEEFEKSKSEFRLS